jgi:hypothetical protein
MTTEAAMLANSTVIPNCWRLSAQSAVKTAAALSVLLAMDAFAIILCFCSNLFSISSAKLPFVPFAQPDSM